MVAHAKERTTSRSVFETHHSKVEIATSSDEKKGKKIPTFLGSNILYYCLEVFISLPELYCSCFNSVASH